MVSYADLDLLKSQMDIGDDDADTLLQMALDTATSWIRQYTGRSFAAEAGATKYFTALNGRYLDLSPDLRAVTSVAVDVNGNLGYARTLVADTDFTLAPLNPQPDAGIYSSLEILPLSSLGFTPGRRVKVIGDWGYVVDGEAPIAIQHACLLQAARLFKRKESPLGILQNTDLGQYTRLSAMDPDVKALLDPYRSGVRQWVAV